VPAPFWVKSERYFDLYDQVFAHTFKGAELKGPMSSNFRRSLGAVGRLAERSQGVADALGINEEKINKLRPDELLQYFLDRLKKTNGGTPWGGNWIGTGGTSPVGHSGYHPGGMRIGGSQGTDQPSSGHGSKVSDYSQRDP